MTQPVPAVVLHCRAQYVPFKTPSGGPYAYCGSGAAGRSCVVVYVASAGRTGADIGPPRRVEASRFRGLGDVWESVSGDGGFSSARRIGAPDRRRISRNTSRRVASAMRGHNSATRATSSAVATRIASYSGSSPSHKVSTGTSSPFASRRSVWSSTLSAASHLFISCCVALTRDAKAVGVSRLSAMTCSSRSPKFIASS